VDSRTTTADTRSFSLSGGRVGCLLLHGFTGTPHEMRYLGDHLAALGYSVCGVRLAGHATSVEDFATHTWQDWYASAAEGLRQLRQHAAVTIVVGQSMGALLALKMAADFADTVAALVLLAPAVRLANPWLPWIGPFLPVLLPLLPRRWRWVEKGTSDIADPLARAMSPNYRSVPLAAVIQLLRLQRQARRAAAGVQQPVLIVHARQDHTCPVDNVTRLQQWLPRPPRVHLLDDSYHVITVDVEKKLVASLVAGFVSEAAVHHTGGVGQNS
jgi:carboxylesterase